MDELIDVLQSIKSDVNKIKGCTIVLGMNDNCSVKIITADTWGEVFIEDF